MMDILTDWITNIVIFILLAGVMDMLLPSSAMQKYAKMVLGLLLITLLLSPLFKLISVDFDSLLASFSDAEYVEKNQMENRIENKKTEIQAVQDAYILEKMAVQLEKDGEEELVAQFNYEIADIDVAMNGTDQPQIPGDLEHITVVLAPVPADGQAEIETVAEVTINIEEPLPDKDDGTKDIREFLADKWEVDADRIHVNFERRGTAR